MNAKIISGIQQIGIGVRNIFDAWKWYKEHFGVDIRIFQDASIAEHMRHYTGGEPQKRHAAFALNLQGGGGFEIWQYTERTPQSPKFKVQIGDLGIYAAKIKSKDVRKIAQLAAEGADLLSEGVKINVYRPDYIYTDLDALKVEMIGKATSNAAERAQTIAKQGRFRLGNIVDDD